VAYKHLRVIVEGQVDVSPKIKRPGPFYFYCFLMYKVGIYANTVNLKVAIYANRSVYYDYD